MHIRTKQCQNLTERDLALLYKIEVGLPITADVSRADVLLCCLLSPDQILVACHARPRSISSIYLNDATGRVFRMSEQPLVHRALSEDRPGTRRKQVLSSGAPIIQQIYPIHNAANRAIAAMMVETNMIEFERHRRRDKPFRRAVRWLQEMAIRGEIEIPEPLSGFDALDGIYLVDERSHILYMSGIATNLYRSIGIVRDMRGQHVSELESLDEKVVSQALQSNRAIEVRHETEEGRIWTRSAIPLRSPQGSWYHLQRRLRRRVPGQRTARQEKMPQVDGALVLVHNATERVQKERELNVKSAMIQEVHHRVKNNLQTVAAILRIQARRSGSEEARQHLSDAVNRVLSMSVIHEFLSQDEHRPINIKEVCQRIVAQTQRVASNPGQEIQVTLTGPNIRLPAGQATAATLVMNELLLNAIEHGLQGRSEGHIHLTLEDRGDSVRLTVEDDGLGMPEGFALGESRSLGLQITSTLVTDDLKGALRYEPVHASDESAGSESAAGETADGVAVGATRGTRAIVTFPKRAIAHQAESEASGAAE